MERYRALLAAGTLAFDPAQEEAAERLQTLHEALEDYRPAHDAGWLSGLLRKPEPVNGLYLCGDVGRGKSMLMDLFYDTASVTPKRRVHFHVFMQEVHEAIARWRRLDDQERRTRLRRLDLPGKTGDDPIPPVARAIAQKATLLAFDEFQVGDVTDAMILGRLFEALFADGVVVVATSNVPPEELYKGGLNRQLFEPFIDLIRGRMEVHRLDSATDYRLGRLQGRPVYFSPLGPEATRAMDATWADLTEGEEETPCTVTVQGRTLSVPRMAKRMARFTFHDLFEQPLGPADYLRIAEVFRAVFVDGVPRMGPQRRNEAKRFVTFIDAVYEARIPLILSAEAPPQELYPAGDHSFEFARTVSRLMEMQSQDYGG